MCVLNRCKNGETINPQVVAPGNATPQVLAGYHAGEDETAAAPAAPGAPAASTAPGNAQTHTYQAQFLSVNILGQLNYKKFSGIGIRTLIVRVFQDEGITGGLFFHNSHFRTLDTRLEKISAEMKSQEQEINLDLCAWMITRKFNWIPYTYLFDYRYENGRRELVRKFDIFNPAAVDKIVAIYKELAAKDIDSILIQDDFFLRYNEGFSDWGKANFSQAVGLPAHEKLMMSADTPYNKKWNRLKREQLIKVLTLIIKGCKQVKPAIKLGMNIYYETPLFIERGENWYAHNLQEIVNTGIDYIYLMSYHRQVKRELRLTESENRLLVGRIIEKAYGICKEKLIVKLQIRDWDTGDYIPLEEVSAYLDMIPQGVGGICFIPVKADDGDYLEKLICRQPGESAGKLHAGKSKWYSREPGRRAFR